MPSIHKTTTDSPLIHVKSAQITVEVIKNPLAESPVDPHKVRQAVEVLSAGDPVGFFCPLSLLTWVVEANKAAL